MTSAPPDLPLPDPAALRPTPFEPAARRSLRVFGRDVELVWLPERAARQGRPAPTRPAFRPDFAAGVIAAEAQWRGGGLVATPNKYPFARQQSILWQDAPGREHGDALWRCLCELVDRRGGTGLVNSIGAAASSPRAHGHWTPEELPFLAALPERPLRGDWVPTVPGATFVQADLPLALVGARGDAAARTAAVQALQALRLSAAFNAVVQRGALWLLPRAIETPAPHFPYPLGAAELWGRWCWLDESQFAAATGAALEQALVVAAYPPLPRT